MLSSTLSNHPISALQWGVVLVAALVAAAWDMRTGRIPNLLTGPLLLAGLAAAVVFAGAAGLKDAGAGCLLLGIPYVLLFVFAGGGAGDAKMMAALGAWLGFGNSVIALAAVSLSGAVLGVLYAARTRKLGAVYHNVLRMFVGAGAMVLARTKLSDAQGLIPAEKQMLPMPYGLAILAGMCLALAGRALWHA